MHALAVHWHPASAAAVAGELRLDVKAVSSQLTRLVREGVVEAVSFDPSTKTGFQLAERFFNIWYLMRATRRARRRLIWLVEFLKMWYSQEQLRSHALEHLARESRLPSQERLRFAEYSFALAEVFQESPFRSALETSGLYALMETSIRNSRTTVELSPENAFAWLNLGLALGLRNRLPDAEEACRRSVELSPENTHAWQTLGLTLAGQGRFREAEEAFRKSVELSPDDASTWQNLSMVRGRLGRFGEQEAALRKALDLDPDSGSPARELAWFLFQQNRNSPEAEDLARQAVRAEPKDRVHAQTLACILARSGKWSEAFEQAGRFIADGSEGFHERNWREILLFFREAVSAGKTREAADLLDRLGMADRWQPLREALETVAVGRRSYLRRLAPEVRQATEEILKQLEEGQGPGTHSEG